MGVVKLVSISEYARYWNIDRKTIYKLIDSGRLTRYEDSLSGIPLLNPEERPVGIKKYGEIRKRKIV